MTKRKMSNSWRVMTAMGPILFGAAAWAADNGPATRAPAERGVLGTTHAERAAQQADLHAELMAALPAADHAPVQVGITQKDRDDLAAPAPNGTAPLKVGVVKSVPGALGKTAGKPFNKGVVEQGPGGSFVWAATVTSPGAQAIRLHLTEFSLPDNTAMYLVGPNGQAHGPYVGQGRNGNGEFWTRSIASDTGTVVLRYTGNTPDDDRPDISFEISDVGHIRGRPPLPEEQIHDTWPCGGLAACVVDANCVAEPAAESAKDAVAKMEWIKGPFVYTCTGGLLADTVGGESQIPYFLTANHCLNKDNANLETFFNYTTNECNDTCPHNSDPASTIGARVVATGRAGDFTLLELDEDPPAGAVFLG